MTGMLNRRASVDDRDVADRRPWWTVIQGAAALAAGMGLGRFAYTPILPLMQAQAGLSAQLGATLATANYVGYLAGALAAIIVPSLARSAGAMRVSLVVLIATLALMPASHSGAIWITLRLIAGAASALIFIIAASTTLTRLRGDAHHLIGWSFGGIGAGIALSGVLALLLRTGGTWQQAWWFAAALAVVFTIVAWALDVTAVPAGPSTDTAVPTTGRWFTALLASYTLEGVGYIIAGTFLVAAVDQTTPGWVGSGAWVLVGLAALPSAALWAWLNHIWSRPTLLVSALVVQAVGIALPALIGGVTAALISAILFGTTFLGIATITLAIGAHLRVLRAVAILTTGYGLGQILGPLVVTPLLHNGYREALLVAAGVTGLAAIAAGAVRRRFPHDLAPRPGLVGRAT